MNLLLLVIYGAVNTAMILSYLPGKGRFYQFPFWAAILSMAWFFPQAVGGYLNISRFPENAYADAMFFAALCSIALWLGFEISANHDTNRPCWLGADFDIRRLYWAGVVLCVFGFYFQWKLWSLPEEMLAETQWSGATVKYHFFASVFKIGFLTIWLIYLCQMRVLSPQHLVFIIPCFLMVFSAAFMRGRRAEMMNLVSYTLVSLWFVRHIALPRWFIVSGLVGGLLLVNGIGTYRSIMKNEELSLSERMAMAADADYLEQFKEGLDESGSEFSNYVFYRQVIAEDRLFDLGGFHWNRFVFNYVPAQILGRDFKESLMIQSLLEADNPILIAQERYGYPRKTGSTLTGFYDAFASFGWLGFVKFLLIGMIMGVLHRYAMKGKFLAQLLYVYTLGTAMHTISHGTHRILVSTWVYFFLLGFPALLWAKLRKSEVKSLEDELQLSGYEHG